MVIFVLIRHQLNLPPCILLLLLLLLLPLLFLLLLLLLILLLLLLYRYCNKHARKIVFLKIYFSLLL
jgi:hypothetical protein